MSSSFEASASPVSSPDGDANRVSNGSSISMCDTLPVISWACCRRVCFPGDTGGAETPDRDPRPRARPQGESECECGGAVAASWRPRPSRSSLHSSGPQHLHKGGGMGDSSGT
eukprot:1196386-Prorocentrum_minimum.AAC.4